MNGIWLVVSTADYTDWGSAQSVVVLLRCSSLDQIAPGGYCCPGVFEPGFESAENLVQGIHDETSFTGT